MYRVYDVSGDGEKVVFETDDFHEAQRYITKAKRNGEGTDFIIVSE